MTRVLIPFALFAAAAAAQEEAPPRPTVPYYLPFAPGFSVNVWQGNDQEPSHHTPWAKYAFDFSPLEVGTAVHAAATGVVVYVKEDSQEPTGNPLENNEIAVQHADGNVSTYLHLVHQGALVQVGDVVLRGDRIGSSGNTGKSTEPHLCFSLRRGHRMRGLSEPVRFVDVEGDGVPETDDTVRSDNRPLRALVGDAGVVIAMAELVARLGLRETLDARVEKALAGPRRRPADERVAGEIEAVLERAREAWRAAGELPAPQGISKADARKLTKAVETEWKFREAAAYLAPEQALRAIGRYRDIRGQVEDEALAAALDARIAFLEGYLPAAERKD